MFLLLCSIVAYPMALETAHKRCNALIGGGLAKMFVCRNNVIPEVNVTFSKFSLMLPIIDTSYEESISDSCRNVSS